MRATLNRYLKRCIDTLTPMAGKKPAQTTLRRTDVWSIGIYVGDSPFDFSAKNVCNPVLTYKDVNDLKAAYVADPFMVRSKDTWFMFFEVVDRDTRKGKIGLATSKDGLGWKYRQIVLDESFHLSYPYVFEWDGVFYMIPESYQANAIRLYRADEFPTKWSYVETLLDGGEYADSSIFRYDNQWWLFTTNGKPPFYADSLYLYYAKDLLGPWLKHPQNPIIKDKAHIARLGGRVLLFDDKIVRYAQDCSSVYGKLVRAFEITHLSNTGYEEREVEKNPILTPTGYGWNEIGMHHIDPHLLEDGRWLACVDGWRWVNMDQPGCI